MEEIYARHSLRMTPDIFHFDLIMGLIILEKSIKLPDGIAIYGEILNSNHKIAYDV